MGSRLNFQTALCNITPHVYFQPPASKLMEYPCIVYKRINARTFFANNKAYRFIKCYEVTVIDKNPDGSIVDALLVFPKSELIQNFTSDNLHHDIFRIYF